MPLSFTIAFPSLSSICIAIAKKLHIPACKIIWPCYEATYHLANLVFSLPMVTFASTRICMFLYPIFPPLYFTQGRGSTFHLIACKTSVSSLDSLNTLIQDKCQRVKQPIYLPLFCTMSELRPDLSMVVATFRRLLFSTYFSILST